MVERFAGPKGRGGGRKSEEDVPLCLSSRHFLCYVRCLLTACDSTRQNTMPDGIDERGGSLKKI
ncbi:hypothetical protein J437_LFUL016021 [Ladona fulva]|uniref:Uncharacterized protein n=1 Tax=Ladona fulva TaxID=123851 RepID=A0A8K0P594_LADFU|nr:hypothetical protein J437_LFUL016021 [Ladona fulva]